MRAVDEERELDGLADEQLLELAASETRATITFDAKDFTVIARRWAHDGRRHAGLGIVVGHRSRRLRPSSMSLTGAFRSTEQSDWTDLTVLIARSLT